MFSLKNSRHQTFLVFRAGLKTVMLVAVAVMLFVSMATTNSFAAAASYADPMNPTPTPAPDGGCISTADCLSKMTLDEKIGQMTQVEKNAFSNAGNSPTDITTYFIGSLLSGGGEGPNGAGGTATEWANMYDNFQGYALQTRLKIPLIYGVDAVHGHNNVYGAVIFPHHIGMGATRDTALVQQADQVTRDEVLGTGIDWVFAPCVCVPRDDRWGRTYEGYGEDPTLVSSMGVASIKGFQGTGLGPTTVMATAKHYIADGGTTFGTGDSGYLIDQGDAQISETVLRAIHLPPYQSAVQNGVGSVMISYSSWNGAQESWQPISDHDCAERRTGLSGHCRLRLGGHRSIARRLCQRCAHGHQRRH